MTLSLRSLAWLAGAACAALATLVVLTTAVLLGSAGTPPSLVEPAAPELVSGIPAAYLRLYVQAGRRYGVDWAVLAGIGRVECDHGEDPAASCTQEGAVNSAGAGGPAQFLAGTWAAYGVDADGDGRADRWDPADAIFSMANYLRASGAPGDYPAAIYAYNHAWW